VRRTQTWIRFRRRGQRACLVAIFAAALSVGGAWAELPWALRDHLVFQSDAASVLYSVEDGRWRVDTAQAEAVIDGVGFEVVRADGTTVTGLDLGKAALERAAFDRDGKAGDRFTCVFAPKDGLEVRHELITFHATPFLEIHVSVRNVGDAPVDLAVIRPVVLGPDAMKPLSAQATMRGWPARMRGRYTVFCRDAPHVFSVLSDPAAGLCLALGVLPQGRCRSGARFAPSGGRWLGAISCEFDPPLELPAGAILRADPVWLCYAVDDPAKAEDHYAWACRGDAERVVAPDASVCWATVADGAPAGELYDTARAWAGAAVRRALVPGTWEGRPGSMRGAEPHYPRDMKEVAARIEALDMTPGLTFDPLVIGKGDPAWSALSVDGSRWLNPSESAAREQGAKRVRRALDWGFRFLVLPPSSIPDEVLRHFGLTREHADRLAFDLVRAAAGDVPVLASSAAVLEGDAERWRAAAACVRAMAAYQVALGPVRFDTDGLTALEPGLAEALAAYDGPVELVGRPKARVRDEVVRQLAAP